MSGAIILAAKYLNTVNNQDWQIQAVQDANADGKADLLWLNGATGQYYGYLMNGSQITGVLLNHLVPDLNWHFQANGRFAGNDLLGLLQRHTNGQWRVLQSLAHNTLSYYHNDHLGTPKMLTAQDGKIVWQADYSPFGKVKVTQAWVDNPIRFPGQYHDQETGLYYNYFRYYDPEIGRYVTSDPIGLAGGINTYAYVGGNPVNYTDPLGLFFDPYGAGGFWHIFGGGWHYDRNIYNRHPKNESDAQQQGWIKLPPNKSIFHTMGCGNENNSKYVSPTGIYEGVFHEDGSPVHDPANWATYNYYGPTGSSAVGHAIFDVVPYFFLGNTRDDPSTFWERVTASYDACSCGAE